MNYLTECAFCKSHVMTDDLVETPIPNLCWCGSCDVDWSAWEAAAEAQQDWMDYIYSDLAE